MRYRELGRSGIEVSEFALGCWPFAGGDIWGYQDDNDSIATARAALDAGINFFDTAEGYGDGHSEDVLGQALEGRRHEAVIATKVGDSHLKPEDVRASCERSLRLMRTDYIDLYQIHWPNHDIPISETMGELERLKEEGKIRAIGVCNFGPKDLDDLLAFGHTETDQLPYNLTWRAIEYEIQPKCVENGIGLICYSPLAQGILAGRYASADEVPPGLARSRHFSKDRPMSQHGEPGCERELFEAVDRVQAVAERLDEPMASVALAWVRQQPGVTSLLVGARNPEELQWNLPAFELTLPDDAVRELSKATEEVKQKIGDNPDMWRSPGRMR
ncbi:MAG: aldo/keto reductase [Chloroflexota bacterium]